MVYELDHGLVERLGVKKTRGRMEREKNFDKLFFFFFFLGLFEVFYFFFWGGGAYYIIMVILGHLLWPLLNLWFS